VSSVRLFREWLAELAARGALGGPALVARDLAEARPLIATLARVVVLLDASDAGAPELARQLARCEPVVAIIAFASSGDVDARLLLAESGVLGYLPRDGSVADLLAVVESACRGDLVCDARLAGGLARRLAQLAGTAVDPTARAERLTHRERELVRLVDEGKSNKEIASQLHIEVATVKNHIHHILRKLGVHRRGEAAAALRRWTSTERWSARM